MFIRINKIQYLKFIIINMGIYIIKLFEFPTQKNNLFFFIFF